MKKINFIVVLVLCIGSNALATKPALQSEIDQIEAQLKIAKDMDVHIDAAQSKCDLAETNVETTKKELAVLKNNVEREKAKKLAALTNAIHMTILAWDLAPANLHGTSVMRRTDGRRIVWQPIAGEAFDRSMQNAKGALKSAGKPKDKDGNDLEYAGITYSDGVTFIPQSTFDRGVSYLASTLLHERNHFNQYTTETKRGMSRAEREREAYQSQSDNVGLFFVAGKDDEFIRDIEKKLIRYEGEVKREKSLIGRVRRVIPFAEEPDMAEVMIHTNDELADIAALVATARSQAVIARIDREKREAIARDAAEKVRQRDEDDRLRDLIVSIAQRSCSSPGSVGQAELDELPSRKSLDDLGTVPNVGNCISVYYYLAFGGRNAEDLRRKATPEKANVIIGRPAPEAAVEVSAAPPPFSSVFPEFKEFAIAVCLDPGRAPISHTLTQPYDLSNAAYDNNLARSIASSLADCPRAFFYRMLEMYRAGDWRFTDEQWIRETVAAYSRAPDAPPAAGGGRRKRCEDYGNIYCP